MQLPEAVLVFDARDAETTGEYEVFAIPPKDADGLWRTWGATWEGLAPTGRIPVSDVEFDETRGFRIHTLGIERFAKTEIQD